MGELKTEINYGNLKKLIKAMGEQYSVKVGLLKGKGGDNPVSEDMDEAGLGALQEFGADIKVTDKMRGWFWYNFGVHLKATHIHIPARSWLGDSLKNRSVFLKNIKKGMTTQDFTYFFEKTGDLQSIATMVGAGALETIMQAFETSGWGSWAENSPLTVMLKGSSKPLQNLGTLKNAVTYEIEKKQ
jgi:hypothetical protein